MKIETIPFGLSFSFSNLSTICLSAMSGLAYLEFEIEAMQVD